MEEKGVRFSPGPLLHPSRTGFEVRSTIDFEEVLFEICLLADEVESYFYLMYYVYILKLRDSSYYVGYSANLKQRINEHNRSLVDTTSNNLPISLVFYAAFATKDKALKFEKYLKEGSGFAFRNRHLV